MHALLVQNLGALCIVAGGAQTVDLEPPVAGELALLEDGAIGAEERYLAPFLTYMENLQAVK